jgi:hypothetical protein
MQRKKLTLSIEEGLILGVKMRAIGMKTDVSSITEDLYREFLLKTEADEAAQEMIEQGIFSNPQSLRSKRKSKR